MGGVDVSLEQLKSSKANQLDLNTLKSRVDLLTQTPSEETEGNAELIDIRVGADGKTYPTAGDAVRSQFKLSMRYLGFINKNIDELGETGIVNADDLIDTSGWYQVYINASSYNIETLNFPEVLKGYSGILEIYRYSDNYVIQRIQTRTSIAFRQRTFYLGWTQWIEFDFEATTTELEGIRDAVSQFDKTFMYKGYLNSGAGAVSSESKLDANDLEDGWYQFYFSESDFDSLTLNFPTFLRGKSGVIQSLRYNDIYCSQLAWNKSGLGFRQSTSAGWTQWIIVDQSTLFNEANLNTITENVLSEAKGTFQEIANPGVSAFDSLVVIGDSLSVGYTQLKNGDIIRPDYKKSFPQYFVKKYNTKVYWGGSSGAGVLDILDNVDPTSPAAGFTKRGWDYIESLGKQALYLIILGVNDAGQDKTPIGSSSDIGTDNRTFYGGLSKIVEKIHILAPNAYVVLSTPILNIPSNFKQAILEVANNYPDYTTFIDFTPYIEGLAPMKIAGHYSQNGYCTAGAIIDYLIGKAIESNPKFIYINDANNDIEDKGVDPYQ